ncbi:MAG: XdhC family protein [Pseudomonadales bacterium]
MQAVDEKVLARITECLSEEKPCWLATVVATYGSSPRPVGSLLTCDSQGEIVGSLSGGCVEDDLLEKLTRGLLARERAQFFRYGEDEEEAEKLGLPCGGHLDIVVEALEASMLPHFEKITQRLQSRNLCQRTVDLCDRSLVTFNVDRFEELRYDEDAQTLVQTYGPRYQLFLIGAGMVSQYVAEMAQALDYRVVVCDPRQDVLDGFPVAGVEKICDMPDDAIRESANDCHTAIIALTHDPRIDDMGLMEALKTDAFYVGAMGSSRTSDNRRDRLRALDISDDELERLHAPVGLPIGSKTPPEIALAVLAEITAIRKQRETDEATPSVPESSMGRQSEALATRSGIVVG